MRSHNAFRLVLQMTSGPAVWRLFFLAGLLLFIGFVPVYASTINSSIWYEFSFTDVGVQARGCFPDDPDPNALDCLPSSAGNSMIGPAPPWTFTLSATSRFIVTDAFLHGDSFDIKDGGILIFSTPAVATDGSGCGDDPEVCVRDPLSSHASFLLGAGPHSITIFPNAIADAGAGYFMLVPEPSPRLLLLVGLAALYIARRLSSRSSRGAEQSSPVLSRGALLRQMIMLGLSFLCLFPGAHAQTRAQDASNIAAPLATLTSEYDFGASVNNTLLPGCTITANNDCKTQIHAAVNRPQTLTGRYPLLVFLHGNHDTCGQVLLGRPDAPGNPRRDFHSLYTFTGSCNFVTAILSVTLNVGQPGQMLAAVAVIGQGTHFVNGTTAADFGAGITVNSTTVADATHAAVSITIAAGAAAGGRTVTMTTGAEVASLANGFTVGAAGALALLSVTPNIGQIGDTLPSISVVGQSTHFVNGITVADFGAGITVNSTTVTDATHATVSISISGLPLPAPPGGAARGGRIVTMTTGAEVVSLANGFTVGDVTAPSYQGYSYLADRLASLGYIVVSVDANRGITFPGVAPAGVMNDLFLIIARGRLVLKHLQQLSQCNTNGNSGQRACDDLFQHIDFNNVGLTGHSRGGEGVRAAYNLYRPCLAPNNPPGCDPSNNWPTLIPDGVTFKGIFEIAPTDNMCRNGGGACTATDRANTFDVLGTTWNVLLPMCDADVNDLSGVKPFDRQMLEFESLPTQKSTYLVWGANHNFYNTQWQESESTGCRGPGNTPLLPDPMMPMNFLNSPGSPAQRRTSISSVLAFFRANAGAGADAGFNQNFNPLYDIPATVDGIAYPARVFRGYVPSSGIGNSLLFNDFDGPADQSSYGVLDTRSGVPAVAHGTVPDHDQTQMAGLLSWNGVGGPNLYYQMNWTNVNQPGRDVSAYMTLDFRISRQDDAARNTNATTNFSIRLVGANGVMTRAVTLNRYTDFRDVGGMQGPGGPRGPVGIATVLHPTLQTVRIPLTDFGNFNFIKNQVRGVRFIFDQDLNAGMSSGSVHVANVRFVNTLGSGAAAQAPFMTTSSASPGAPISPGPPTVYPGTIVALVSRASSPELGGQPGIEVWLNSTSSAHGCVPASPSPICDIFPAANNALILTIGSLQNQLVHYPNYADDTTIVFTLTPSEFAQVSSGDPVTVQYGFTAALQIWNFGSLNKNILTFAP